MPNFAIEINHNAMQRALVIEFRKEVEEKLARVIPKALERTASQFSSDCLADYTAFSQEYGMNNLVDIYMEGAGSDSITLWIAGHMFMEYGTGITYQAPYPEPTSYGAGTWSDSAWGKGHWDDPNGWYDLIGNHHMGCPPAMIIYNRKQEIIENFQRYLVEELQNDKGR